MACRNGGRVSVAGVYDGFVDKFPFGSAMNRSLTIKTGQTHVHRYMRPLLQARSTRVSSSHIASRWAPHAYEIFTNKEDRAVKIVLKP